VNCVRFKSGVTLNGLQPAGARILSVLDRAAVFFQRDLTVTCGTDSHPADDPHTLGRAFDIRTRDLPQATIVTLIPWLQKSLGPDFTVLYETPTKPVGFLASLAFVNPSATSEHCHIQVRKGYGEWPPAEATTTTLHV